MKAIQQFVTTAGLLLALLLVLVRCSGQAMEGSLQSGLSRAAVDLEIVAADLLGVQTRDLGLCVAEFRLYPNDLEAKVVRVTVQLNEIQFSEDAVSLGKLTQVPANSYYLVELVLRDQCAGSSSRFLKGEQYFSTNEEIVLRFRGNTVLGYSDSHLSLDIRPFLVALDSVENIGDIRRYLLASEGSF
ncbi:MAG: hypothetical protein H6617_11325 [Bdellovibrionaceae bacterium]|nr:hypothetical protein [Bdellovibrionales bacterium]MCB9255263.1 hypothetical protein [Pseudobdellovibrionaceae bacterium]